MGELPSLSSCHLHPTLTSQRDSAASFSLESSPGGEAGPRDSMVCNSETPFSVESTPFGQVDTGPKDSLQDIIFDSEETEKVRHREEQKKLERSEETLDEYKTSGEECSPCLQCREKRKRNYSVRFNLNVAEEKRRKKKSIFEVVVLWILKLKRKFQSKRFC